MKELSWWPEGKMGDQEGRVDMICHPHSKLG